MRPAVMAALILSASPAAAAGLSDTLLPLPAGAEQVAQERESLGSYAVPSGPWSDGRLPSVPAEGVIVTTAWQASTPATTLEVLDPIRSHLREHGFRLLLDCADRACGGFDFRFATRVLPEPAMHVDLADFRFLSATRAGPGDGAEYATLLISRRAGKTFVQLVHVLPRGTLVPDLDPALATKTPTLPAEAPEATTAPADIVSTLTAQGRAVLDGLSFETGSSRLTTADVPVLAVLADWLKADPARRITLVGHTDAEGALDANLSLSRARARAVAEALVEGQGVNSTQVSSDGVGYLMPLAPNATESGRALNRRVEAVLLAP